ncbi:HU family DNA-binding protein (plasmid) [Deinococcus sp. KNUC1210]|uniref:HU family DNA-binding protein n=1 Tax=Deinococcus sp. KNUC1210 TaxID=2917691 RepID=UPI001EF0A900|nr:HU family DNA-binding protein [Deinococcus sp. KNUC1210]ULH17980.1 HU family DNA-binding protein [Deinococcus sp. KNUC1210]
MTKKSPANTPSTPVPASALAEGEKLSKVQLIEQVAQHTSLSKQDASRAVDAALAAIAEVLRGGKTVGLPGLGTLDVRATAARTGVRPGTAEKIQIPAGKKVGFKVATDLKKAL